MRLIENKTLFILIPLFLLIVFNYPAEGLRISRPVMFSRNMTDDQIHQLNKFLEDVWNLQQGRFEADIVTTTKTNAKNGEFWFIKTGATVRLQYKANGHIFTITPDGF